MEAACNRRLGRTVEIGECRLRHASHPVGENRRGQHLAAPKDAPEGREGAWSDRSVSCHVRHRRRNREPLGQLALCDEARKAMRNEVQLGGHEVEFGARDERAEDVERGEVEVQWRMTREPVTWLDREVGHCPIEEGDHVLVGDDDALGRAGRAGGEEDVRRVLGLRRAHVLQRVELRGVARIERGLEARAEFLRGGRPDRSRGVEGATAPDLGDELGRAGLGQKSSGLCRSHDHRRSRRRAPEVDRDVRTARAERAQHGRNRGGRL